MNFNKVCELEDFSDPELAAVIRDVCDHKAVYFPPEFPVGAEARKDWEVAMTVRALRHFGAIAPDAKILGVGAGTEDTIFYLSRHVGQVFVTDRYLDAGAWSPLAPVAMLIDPSFVAPFEFDSQRLVVQHMDGRALRYPDETFDGVFSSGSIEHFGELEDVANAAYEMGRVLKPGGILALSTEFRFSGPPGGVGWPGSTLLLSEAEIQRYIVEASGLEPVDELHAEVSERTIATRRDFARALADHDARVAEGDGEVPEYTCWDFPHVVLVHDGYVFGSVHLTLRRSDAHPCIPNAWAKPGERTLGAIVAANREILGAGAGRAPTAEAPAASAPAAPPPPPASPLGGSWEDRRAAAAQQLAAATEHAETAVARLGGIAGHAVEVRRQLADIAQAQADVERLLGTVSRLRAVLDRRRSREPLPETRLAPTPEPDRSTWRSAEANLGGRTVAVTFDSGADDPVSAALASGYALDQHLVALMLEIVRPGDVVVDLGAHIGTFALPAAAHEAGVVAVEASSDNAALLRASAARNRFRNLNVVHAVASDRPGTVEFSARGPWGHLATPAEPLPAGPVLAVTVDELLTEMGLPSPAFVKMDIEGSEVAALRGMRRVLSGDDAPPVLYESNGHTLAFFGTTPEELVAELAAFGYTNYLVESDRLVRIEPGVMQPQTEVNCLALKHRPEALRRWQFAPSLTPAERAARMAADCRSPNPDHRAYMARVLRGADPTVLGDPDVAAAMTALRGDPEPAVREAVAWWSGPERSDGAPR
ncbi:MAG TPA: class I SAM-dependent methyltransferase [Acidimicrobiales bacterium]|nr:class I SAM-dependent methyltransferase [Acidimicrobiales bacterium]